MHLDVPFQDLGSRTRGGEAGVAHTWYLPVLRSWLYPAAPPCRPTSHPLSEGHTVCVQPGKESAPGASTPQGQPEKQTSWWRRVEVLPLPISCFLPRSRSLVCTFSHPPCHLLRRMSGLKDLYNSINNPSAQDSRRGPWRGRRAGHWLASSFQARGLGIVSSQKLLLARPWRSQHLLPTAQ